MATADPPNNNMYTITSSNTVTVDMLNTSIANSGNIYYTSGTGSMYVSSGTHWVPVAPGASTVTISGMEYIAFNGDPNDRLFKTMEERIEYQQQAYEEPRGHAFNPGDLPDLAGSYAGMCQDCYPHSIHRWDASTHLFVIDEEIDWVLRLAS